MSQRVKRPNRSDDGAIPVKRRKVRQKKPILRCQVDAYECRCVKEVDALDMESGNCKFARIFICLSANNGIL